MKITTQPQTDPRTDQILWILFAWRIVFALPAFVMAANVWGGAFPDLASWLRVTCTLILSAASILSLFAAAQIFRRHHSSRVISLVLDYLAFVFFAVLLLNTGEVFTGLDALGETFGRGIPYLGIVLAGYLLGSLDDYFPQKNKAPQNSLKIIGRWVMIAGFVLFLWRIGTMDGLLYFVGKLAQPAGLVSAAAVLIFGTALRLMSMERTSTALGAKAHHEQMLNGWLFLSPNLLGFLVFFAGPLLLSFYFSFTDSDAYNTPNWVGFANYAKILSVRLAWLSSPDQLAREVIDIKRFDEVGRFIIGDGGILFAAADKFFWLALRNTLTFVLLAVPLSVIPALFLSSMLNSKLPGMKFYRAIYFMPSIAAVVGISLVWQWLYNATIGYINYFITTGIDLWNQIFSTVIIDPRIQWVSDESTALLAVIIIAAWQTMGFNTVLFLAGLQNIPAELYEAATVDGAGPWEKFRWITVPLLAPTTFYIVSITTIQAMQVFEQVYILMNPPEGPNNSTITLVLYLYRKGFQNFEQGYASAIAWILFIVIFGLTMIQFRRQRRYSIYES
jgi:ABC-type sugar transport system permease subunit